MSIATERLSRVSVQVGQQEITFETGKLAKQADGAVVVRSGETMVLATAVGRPEAREGADFFPLTIDVEERMYAAGKIPGGFFKREGRASERATLTARMIDRPIRPLWPKGFRNEVQVICTVLSADLVTPHDILCINGASAALMLSPLPFFGPVGAVRIGRIDGEFVVNPTLQQNWSETSLDLIVVGTKDGLTMVEAGADEVPEDVLLEALELAHGEIRKLCEAQEELRRQAGKPKWLDMELTAEIESSHGHAIWERIQSVGLREAGGIVDELATQLAGEITMDSGEEDIQRLTQVRASLNMLLEKQRLAAVEGPVREQFESGLRALTDAEQDSKELKSAKRHLLFDQIISNVELPFPTLIVIGLSHFVGRFWWLIIGLIVLAFFGIRQIRKDPKGRYITDKFLLHVPVLGSVLRKIAVARFTRTLGTLITSGVPILEGLAITARTSGNAVLEEALMKVRKAVEEGRTIVDPLRESGVFPNMVTQMIGVGEATGAMDAMLQKIADFYEDEVDAATKNLLTLMEPMMIGFLGVVVGGIVISLYLPMFSLIAKLS